MNAAAKKIITQLGLAPLPWEGGYFRQIWVSSERRADGRAAGSAIWFLLGDDDFSALHRLRSEETWRYYAGDAVEHVSLVAAAGAARVRVLGPQAVAGATLQLTVPGGVWQGARLSPGAHPCGWALVGCTVTPAWDEREFELGRRATLRQEFSAATGLIDALTR